MGENSGHRIEKVNQLVKEEVGKIILRDLDVSKNTLLTITSTKTSSDLKHATVFISTIDKEKAKSALFELEKNVYDIQHTLNRKLRMRPVPKIKFAIDKAFEKEQKLYEILSDIKK